VETGKRRKRGDLSDGRTTLLEIEEEEWWESITPKNT